MSKTAYSYARFSTLEQEKGNSLNRQMKLTKRWCEANDYVLDTTLKPDRGLSGYRGDNLKEGGSLALFIKLCESGQIPHGSALVVESLDRISRQKPMTAVSLLLSIVSSGIRIVAVSPSEQIIDEETLNRDPMCLMSMVMTLCRSNEESEVKSVRLKEVWQYKREKAMDGNRVRHRCPFWLTYNDEKRAYELNEHVSIVRRICHLYLDNHGPVTIASMFNKENVPVIITNRSKKKSGPLFWSKSTINKIVSNRSLIGEMQFQKGSKYLTVEHRQNIGDAIQNYYPSAIKEADFYRLQSLVKMKKTPGRKRDLSGRITNLFQGKIRCAIDGSNMQIVNKGTKSSGKQLVSSGAVNKIKNSKYVSFPYQYLEEGILYTMKDISISDISPQTIPSDLQDRLDEAETMLGKKTLLMEKMQTKLNVEEDIDLIDTLTPKVVKLRKEVRILKQQTEDLKGEMSASLPTVEDVKRLIFYMRNKDKAGDIEVRHKFRTLFSELIEDVKMLTLVSGHYRLCCLTLHYKTTDAVKFQMVAVHRNRFLGSLAKNLNIDLTDENVQLRLQQEWDSLKNPRSVAETGNNITQYFNQFSKNWK
ncbi:hypothetical protein Pla110_33250 [Polystyrenella longa]|uniref:Resolvase/invertase-type recombinase catalytic domain-containing protein n=1 Tax=Polystyrenella longa TaxID=2528007 RepID=A0A518CQT3_9PLAN|nr:recombinase family protein [Polystyrenella longa]QDU81583.1 hypothetical protein Pla110_33250 [Polystyrenella longa]